MERVYKSDGILFKILPCLLIAMYAVMCLYGSTVCAATYNVTSMKNSFEVILPEKYEQAKYRFSMLVPKNNGEFYSFYSFFSNSPITVKISKGVNFAFNISSEDDLHYTSSVVIYPSNNIIDCSDFSYPLASNNFYEFSTDGTLMSLSFNEFCQECVFNGNVDILDKENNVVFQGASQEALATIIRPQVEGIQLQEILQEIIQILPVILVVIVALIAIRKAIRLLLRVLRNS